jgi:putative SOS response-associated peptidase YedK
MSELAGDDEMLEKQKQLYHVWDESAYLVMNGRESRYHDRMPVILEKEDEGTWLNPDTEVDGLLPLLKPFNDDKMEEWEVGADARDPRNDYPEVIEPHKSSRQRTLF